MNVRFLSLAVAGFVTVAAALPCTASPPLERNLPPIEDGGGGDDPPPPPGPSDYCALTAAGCVAGIVGLGPACAACVGVITCIACAGDAAATIGACLSYSDNCLGAVHEGDLCQLSNRCETGNMHCVNHRCSPDRGEQGERCSTDRDCVSGLTCLADDAGNAPGGRCTRLHGSGELCNGSAECQAGLVCDPNNHTCRQPACGEVIGQPVNTANCPCVIDAAHPGPQGDCLNGYRCDSGRCTQVTVTVCACDGSDAPGTCLSCQPPPTGGGPPGPTFYYYPTCYYFYDARTYYTCASYGDHTECGPAETEFILVDSFCI
jgi:hypothetical protein